MYKYLVSIVVLLAFTFTGLVAQHSIKKSTVNDKSVSGQEVAKSIQKTDNPAKKAFPKGKKPVIGRVINFVDYSMGGKGTVTKDEAEKLAGSGTPIVLLVEGKSPKIYFIINMDGSIGSKNLAKYADSKKVGVAGKEKKTAGINVIVAEMIQSMD